MDIYPEDLRCLPIPLVGLIGEESQKELLIRSNIFKIYKFVSVDNLGSIKLSKKTKSIQFQESYQPEGILKTNWIKKHLEQIPLIFVKFFTAHDLFNQENVVVSHISTLCRVLKERNIKLCFIILVSSESAITNEQFENQLLTIKRKTQFDTRQCSFVFWYESDVKSSLQMVVQNLKESINSSLKERIRKVKKNRDFYIKKTQASLFVRLYFKCGFYAELQGEYKTALKYYLRSYKFLSSVSIRRTSQTEMRAVSEVINLKILFQYLRLNQYQSAVEQFQEHITFGKKIPKEGKDYKFLALSWISQQYKMFANFLEFVPLEKLSPIKNCYENIGFYYNAAANYSTERKSIVQTLKKKHKKKLSNVNVKMFQPSTIYERIYDFSNCNYIGQPNWVLTLDDPLQVVDKQTEDDDYFRELYSETQFDHSAEVLYLLRKAYRNYSEQKPHSERLITTIATRISKEYFEEGEYKFAKKFIEHISETYRLEKWYNVLSMVLFYSLECGLQLKNWRDFMKCLLELLVPKMGVQEETKCILQSKLISLIKLKFIKKDNENINWKAENLKLLNMNLNQFRVNLIINSSEWKGQEYLKIIRYNNNINKQQKYLKWKGSTSILKLRNFTNYLNRYSYVYDKNKIKTKSCNLCKKHLNLEIIEDIDHFLWDCPSYEKNRTIWIKKLIQINKYNKNNIFDIIRNKDSLFISSLVNEKDNYDSLLKFLNKNLEIRESAVKCLAFPEFKRIE
ncbi:trafficking protein particle complex subunit 11 [Anaeramoeba flamelloides]|uniref:Trafficking protein particle complex subunit 11 n=1 Tax=Anaeramoeba flamelloides TaxID=1746091 RepID=A0ABQ8YJY1_9EUKA|nr:trafficking protein particle complex subunit 11 [Anaeramoeba flamelloides]